MFKRFTENPVDPLFLDRWSPRAYDGSEMPQADLETLFDAARWAPSAYNFQPWRFLYARRGDAHWQSFLDLLIPFNAGWAKEASALVFILSDTLMHTDDPGQPFASHSHSFDTGAAWAQLALQATRMGYQAHGMTGLDFDRARTALSVPDRFRIEAAAAIGRRSDPHVLSDELKARETPSNRKPVNEFAFAGRFPG
ncbi:nitroreductase family protein [Sphingomonas sp. LaA6.9]|uniref:nitroreductase family protein n=1 Tax=Sphingomonas sp. LaA6.9 TaxID=2919914 RepID=UPI001F4F600E|nr:nitroreductase family protein [Sphingomonas sp. LaA6.9]MCJ8158365.1 nitroreductase family protein [Sphingomonas sp. LaA6.9]